MGRYIDADEAIRIWEEKDYIRLSKQERQAKKMLDELPSADVVEVRHSTWKEVLAGMDYEYECTRCKACVEQEYPYCPNCGAKMDGESDE